MAIGRPFVSATNPVVGDRKVAAAVSDRVVRRMNSHRLNFLVLARGQFRDVSLFAPASALRVTHRAGKLPFESTTMDFAFGGTGSVVTFPPSQRTLISLAAPCEPKT